MSSQHRHLLAVDVGGTSTRAVVLTDNGECRGYGASRGGNPTSSGPERAASAILAAARSALAQAGLDEGDLDGAVAAIAGAGGTPGSRLRDEFATSGWATPISFRADLLGTYCSGTLAPDGYAVVAGTGAIAARVGGGELVRLGDGLGWLLGDDGSGFWIGRRAVRAVSAALDGRAPDTAMTDAVLQQLEVERGDALTEYGQSATLRSALDALYRMVPVQLADFAPIAFAAADDGDEVASGIVAAAGEALAATLRRVLSPEVDGPLVLGGSVLSRQVSIADRVEQEYRDAARSGAVITVDDGVVGAAVLALREVGAEPDAATFDRLRATLRAKRDER